MPLAKLHVLEGQYDGARLDNVSSAVQNGLVSALGIPPMTSSRLFTFCRRANFVIRRHSWDDGTIDGGGVQPRESCQSVETRSTEQRRSWRGWDDHRRRQRLPA